MSIKIVMKKQVIEIKKWLLENGLKQADIARKANVSNTAVFLFMNKKMVSANIKSAFIELGCPLGLLTEEVA